MHNRISLKAEEPSSSNEIPNWKDARLQVVNATRKKRDEDEEEEEFERNSIYYSLATHLTHTLKKEREKESEKLKLIKNIPFVYNFFHISKFQFFKIKNVLNKCKNRIFIYFSIEEKMRI